MELARSLAKKTPSLLTALSGTGLGSVRGYIANFWSKKTRYPLPGHLFNHQHLFKNKKRLSLEVRDGKRLSNIRRIRKCGVDFLMSHPAGKRRIMTRMLRNEIYLAEPY